MPDTVRVREILLYSEKVAVDDVKNFFNQILKSRIPLFGFIDFSDILSLNVVNLIIKKNMNTIRFFARDKRSLGDMSLLVFPYKISEPLELDKSKGSLFPFPKFYFLPGSQNFLDFSVKENMVEMNLRIIKIFGKFLGYGTAIDANGRKNVLVSTTPEKFMMVDMEQNPAVFIDILDPIPKRMSVTSKYPVFEDIGISVGVDNFDVFQHSLFVGASGTGKSKALYAMVKAIEAKYGNEVKILLVDPHGEFIKSFSDYKIVNLIDNYIEPLDVGGIKTPLMTQLIAQLLASSVGSENKYSERVLFYATHLLSSIDKMSLKNISLLLTDSSKRAEFISECDNDEVKRFFDEEFNDIYIHHFNDAVLPVLNFVGEYELYLGGDKKRENLADLLKNNRITVVSFNPNFFGKRMINFLAGAVINQMYILAITERLHQPTILIVDEFQRVETKVVRDILAETRKFNLFLYISMQYLGQMSKEVHDSVISNIRNIVSFKSNRQDATMLSSIMEIKIEESFKKARSQTELEESKKEMFVRLHQRECIVRLFDGKKYILPMKLKVVDIARWGYKEVTPAAYQHAPPMEHKADYPKHNAEPQMHEEPEAPQEPPARSAPQQEAPASPSRKGADWMGLMQDKSFGMPGASRRHEEEKRQGEEGVSADEEGQPADEPQPEREEFLQEEQSNEEPQQESDEISSEEGQQQEEAPAEEEPREGRMSKVMEQLRKIRQERERKSKHRVQDEEQPAEEQPSEEEAPAKSEEEQIASQESELILPEEEQAPLDEETPVEEDAPAAEDEQAPAEEEYAEEQAPKAKNKAKKKSVYHEVHAYYGAKPKSKKKAAFEEEAAQEEPAYGEPKPKSRKKAAEEVAEEEPAYEQPKMKQKRKAAIEEPVEEEPVYDEEPAPKTKGAKKAPAKKPGKKKK